MRMKFLRWLFLYAAIAFIASLIISFAFETRSFHREIRHLVNSKISEAYEHAQHAQNTLEVLKATTKEIGIKDARFVALALKNDPSIIVEGDNEATTNNLGELASLLQIHEIDIFNSAGICEATWPTDATQIGYDCHLSQYAREFLPIIDDPTLEISQEIRTTEGSIHNDQFQFSAVARLDKPGFVEIGFRAVEVEEAYRLADLSRFVSSVVGYSGFLSVYQGGALKSGPDAAESVDLYKIEYDKTFFADLEGKRYLMCAQKIDDFIFIGGVPTNEIFASRRLTLLLLVLANFLIFFVVFVLISTLVQSLIVDSVYAVNRSLEKITNGDLGERVDVTVSKEFVELSNGVNTTVDSLKQVVEEIKERTKEELLLAKKIQAAALPDLAKLFPHRTHFDVYAQNNPMTSVGGDMFDFFQLDSENVMFYVADVSGHGVPAALVMMKTMALVKNLALSEYDLAKVVSTTNRYLSENNDSSFVTGFFCVFNLKTGKLTYVNAGHNSPFIKRQSQSYEEFQPEINLILGIEPDAPYESASVTLQPGDTFILYTDGITEATTPKMSGCFEVKRALDVLNGLSSEASAKDIVESLFVAVDQFIGHADPSDDETALVFKYVSSVTP